MHVLAHALGQQRCLEVASRLHDVGVVDETRRTYRHHGRQRGAPWRIATFHHATLRVAPHRYATREPLGTFPAALARLARTVRLKRSSACGSETVWRLRATAVQRAADEIEFVLRNDDDNAEGASSSHDHPIEPQL